MNEVSIMNPEYAPIPDGATVAAMTLAKLDLILEQLVPITELFDHLKTHPMLKAFL